MTKVNIPPIGSVRAPDFSARILVILLASIGTLLAQSPNQQRPSEKTAVIPSQKAGQAPPPAMPQESNPEAGVVFKGGTNLVVLHTTVLDDKEKVVGDLTQDDFKVFEDDAPQSIQLFRHEDVPVSLGILVDNSGSMRDKRQKVNSAALDFVKASNPDDEVFIVNFNDEAFLDTPFTKSADRMQDGLQRIDSRGGTALYDATSMSLDYLLEEGKHDKKVLLIISDGEDNASRGTLEKLVRRLEETDTMIFAVGLLSDEDRRSAKRAQRAIRNLARATGGSAYFPETVDELHELTQQIAHAIRNQYILGYHPDEKKPPGFRQIRITLVGKAKKYEIRHRPGYYANAN